MEKDLLKKVLQNYPSSSVEEAQVLHSLSMTYPYSQLLHVLAARASKDHGLTDEKVELQLAAVYSADRGILKAMMENQNGVSFEEPPSPVAEGDSGAKPKSPPKEKRPNLIEAKAEVPGDPDDLAAKVIKDLTQLYNTRHNFEAMFVDNPGADLKTSTSGTEPVKSKRERIIELSKALNAQPMTEEDEVKNPKKKRDDRKEIIDEIADSKITIEPSDERQKEQLQIIEQFIKTQPSISNAKEKPANIQEGDLATIKTGEFGDNIVSETLVELLLKQGKKDKAIEVLKKLIWKFPQKKTYFAAQIEELKK